MAVYIEVPMQYVVQHMSVHQLYSPALMYLYHNLLTLTRQYYL